MLLTYNMFFKETSQKFINGKTIYFLLHGPNKEVHGWLLGKSCSLQGSSCNVFLSVDRDTNMITTTFLLY